MGKRYLKVLSVATLATGILFSSGCGCNSGKVKVTFVTEENSDIIRYVKKGKSIIDLPTPPEVKGKYCVWDKQELKNINEDIVVTAICHSTVTDLYTNVPDVINVDVSSDKADLDYILKDAELEVTFESGEKKKLYNGDYTVDAGDYNKDVGGSYVVSLLYNNAKKDITINVNKNSNYVSVSLDGGYGYYNEGLPKLIANTDVEGTVSFDEGQTLYVGSKAYTWTFVPENSDKYEIVKGNIEVHLYNASSLRANKSALTVAYGTTKNEIIEQIKDGLVVEAKYGNAYKTIDPKYYTIECSDFFDNKAKTYDFKIRYDAQNYHVVSVTVEKCKEYDLSVTGVTNFIMDNDTTLNSVLSLVQKTSSIAGSLTFKEGQILVAGNYEYDYVFTPDNVNYASKEGKVRIQAYKAIGLNYETVTEFEYGSDSADIINSLKQNIEGSVLYNDSHSIAIDKNKVSIKLDNGFNGNTVGVHNYNISYNNEIVVSGSFNINKRTLVEDVDFKYECGPVDADNPDLLPVCRIVKINNDITDDIESLFKIVQISFKDNEDGSYEYEVELVPHESISSIYETITITIEATSN